MADRKISDLTALTAPASGDYLPIVDISEAAAADKNKRITIEELFRGIPLGSAAAPSIAIEGDENTGIYSPGADQLAISTGGTARLTSSTTAVTSALPIDHPLGSAAAPTVTFTGDLNTGIYSPGTDQVAISTNGSGRLFVDASGNVGIGTTPTVRLHVSATDGTIYQQATRGTGTTWRLQTSGVNGQAYELYDITNSQRAYLYTGGTGGSWQFSTEGTERLRITSAGLVGVGTSSPAYNAHITNSGAAGTLSLHGSSGIGYLLMGNTDTSSGPVVISSANQVLAISRGNSFSSAGGGTLTESVRIDSSGRVGLGTSSPSAPLTFAGSTGRKIGFYQGTEGYSIGVESSEFRFVTDAAGIFTFRNGGTYSSSTEYMRLDASGRLGIGTTSPNAKFEILNGHIRISPAYRIGTGGTGDTPDKECIRFSDGSLDFLVANTERARIDSSGRLLVGTSSARNVAYGGASLIQTEITNSFAFSAVQNSNNANGCAISLGKSRGTAVGGTTVLNSGDDIGIIAFAGADGTDVETQAASISCAVDGTPGANDMPGRLVFSTTADGASSPTERMRITNNGAVCIGQTSSTLGANNGVVIGSLESAWTVSGGEVPIRIYSKNTAGTRYCMEFRSASTAVGSITHDGTNAAFNTTSDYRLKENVMPATGGIERLQQLKPSKFNFIANSNRTIEGFIAHEVQSVVPEAVTGTKDEVDADGNPVYQGIDQSKLVPLLTAALQEAVAKIESLEARLTAAGI